ncbi:hypothetical protein ACHAQE_002671 [Botrytis cinerea]
MGYEKPETAVFKCVVDSLHLRVSEDANFDLPEAGLSKAITDELADTAHADKPFGALFNVTPPPPEYDYRGNVTNAPKSYVLTPAQLEALKELSHQPLDRVNASIGFSTHETERNFILLRIVIPFAQIPATIDPRLLCSDGIVIKVKFYSNNMIGLCPIPFTHEHGFDGNKPTTSDAIKLFSINDQGEEVFNGDTIESIPAIVLKTPGFDRVGKAGEPKAKFRLFRWELNVKDVESAISENLMHSTTWPAAPWAPRRVVKFLQFIMSQRTFSLPIYIMDSESGFFEYSLMKCLQGMRKELRDGNPFRGYLSQNCTTNSNVPTIDSDKSFKDARLSPNIVTQKQLQYCTKEEMIVRLAVATMQQPENLRAKVFKSDKAETRVLKALNHFLHSTYPNLQKKGFQSPSSNYSANMDQWSKVLLMNDNRVRSHLDILGNDVGLIMEKFSAKDQADTIEYLRNTPVNTQGKAVAIVEGFPGAGKTEFLAHVIVCMLAQKPQAPIGCICAANQPSDILVKAIERAIEDTCNRQPHLASFLRQQIVIRVHPTAAETNFLIILAVRAPEASMVREQGANFMGKFRKLHALLIDDACLATIIDLIMLLCSSETEQLVLFGDIKQLTPQAPFLQGSQGLSQEAFQDIMTYFMGNHWPKAQLYIQRRGCPEIMEVASQLFYGRRIQDAPVTPGQFPLRDMVANALKVFFPENPISKPYLYINAVHDGEIMDHSTKSWMNLTSAAVNVNLIEHLVTKCNIPPSSLVVITYYTAQLRVYRHAIAKLDSDHPKFAFSEVAVQTTNSIQGGSADITFWDSVRTQNPGFADNPGRNCVALTRARSFEIITANTQQLRFGGRNVPVICKAFDIARKEKACVNISKNMDARHSDILLHRHVHVFTSAGARA